MKIAILSGKGGTGKTLVSVNLAAAKGKATYIDCDVEEPNGHLFFKPENIETTPVSVKRPYADEDKCDGCKVCVDFCRFNALAYIGKLKVFEEVCHSCGGCEMVCPQHAIIEKDKVIGEIRKGNSKDVTVITGELNTGEASGVPIIDKLLAMDTKDEIVVVDCPPGSACSVMESIKDADYCILVGEPTLFGIHNFKMVLELVQLFGKKYGIILNKVFEENNPFEEYCTQNGLKILERIPYDRELSKLNSNSLIVVREQKKFKDLFTSILEKVKREVNNETVVNP